MNENCKSWKLSLMALAALTALALFLSIGGSKAEAAEPVNFGIISTESSQNLSTVWEPFLDDMRKDTGLEIRAFFATDYAGIIEAMRFNKVQLAWYGGKAAMEAVDRADGEVFIQTVDADGNPGYYSHIIANVKSPINSIEDMFKDSRNLNFGNGDPNSTSGFLVPAYYVFALNKVDPKTAFKRTLVSGHEANALSVANNQLDVATCNSEALERLQITAPEKRERIKVIWTSPLIPSDPLVWRKDLDSAAKDKIMGFLMSYGQPGRADQAREAEVLKGLQWKGFQKSTNDQLIPIRQLELFKEKSQLEALGELNDSQKAKLADIEKRLAELDKK